MDKAKKKRIKKVATWVALAAVVALLTAMPLIARSEAEANGPVASILTAEVFEGSISTALQGGGTISAERVEEVTLPDGVRITEFLVKNGSFVTEGTPLACVDKVSVMTAITQVSETLEYLREELEAARDDQVPSQIAATAGGRVKKVFAQKGESVQEVMIRDGALAVLSLDGMMAVKIQGAASLTTGEHITVTLADGRDVDGRVESNLDGIAVITVEDEDYEIGQQVTVSRNGEALGEGSLYIHNAWKAVAYTGTIQAVSAKEETVVSEGASLFTLADRDFEGELRHRANQHREYEQLLQELFQMYESGYLYAPCDGEVEGVDEDSAFLLSAGGQEWTILLLNNTTDQVCKGDDTCKLPADSALHEDDCIQKCDRDIDCDADVHHQDCIKLCDSDNRDCKALVHMDGCISQCTGMPGCLALPAKHKAGCPEKCTGNSYCISTRPLEEHTNTCIVNCIKDTSGADGDSCGTGHAHYLVCIGNCIGTSSCPAINHKADCELYNVTYTATAGIVVRCVSKQIAYKYDKTACDLPVTRTATGSWNLPVAPNPMTMNESGFIGSETEYTPGSMILIVTAHKDDNVLWTKAYPYATGSGGLGDLGGLGGLGGWGDFAGFAGFGGLDLSAMIGGFAGFGNYGAAQPQQEEPLFDLEGATLLTVISHETATLNISIDEHDISKLTTGMAATVKVEAMKGAEFPAEVTAVSRLGGNNGGSSKYRVELTLSMGEKMLSGMSASAKIPLEQKTARLIPAAALVQQGARTMVYTALDDKGAPTAAVEVTTGVTDGENVEILSGLELGQKVYYSYYDTVEIDHSAEAEKYSFG